jgi:ADP-heptose:LPS heptosyltransferase
MKDLAGSHFALSPENSEKKLLAINFGGLGDEVLFLPTLQSIKLQRPRWQITLLTEPRARSITQVTNLVDDNITFDIKKRPLKPQDFLQLIGLLRAGRYDIVLSSGSSPQVSGLLYLSAIQKRIGYGTNALARLLLTNPVPLNRQQHATHMYHDLASGLGITGQASRPQVIVDEESRKRMRDLLQGTIGGATGQAPLSEAASAGRSPASASSGKPIILIHPGTSRLAIEKGIIKTWDPGNWAELIDRLNRQLNALVVLAGGPDDADTIAQIDEKLGNRDAFINAFGKTSSLADLVALIDLSDLLICVDSAPMHLGVGLNKPLVALFGPTDPAKLLWPDPRFIALRDEEAAKLWAGRDPFTQRQNSRSVPDEQPQPYLYVQIPPDTVFRTAADQLNSDVCRGSFPESH